ncbi:hypothetical protein RIF29_36677 [Crotalaria pallida]|uniref:2-oxoglutarate-dependent dioxygenase DAO n=1 Tax=Crotalaria pallida TaxID=3830 RepID=A0AAN9HUG7_CROPI
MEWRRNVWFQTNQKSLERRKEPGSLKEVTKETKQKSSPTNPFSFLEFSTVASQQPAFIAPSPDHSPPPQLPESLFPAAFFFSETSHKMEESIPFIIDLEKISEEKECKKLREACERWGCFRIINHSIPLTLMAEMKSVIGALLELPMEIKKRNTEVIAGSGYMAPSKVNPFYEALGLYDLGSSQAVHNFCSQLDASPHQRQIMEAYGKAIHDLAVKIGQKMAESLGILGADFVDWPCQFRINKYNFTPEAVGSLGVQLHTDSGFLTILQDDENVGGLEVMDNNSGSFLPIPPLPGSLLGNLGDIARVWSNGRFCNVKHRVQCHEASTRFSIATFMLASRKGNVEAPAELVDHDQPRLYQPFIYEDYRKLRVSNEMHTGEALELLRIA